MRPTIIVPYRNREKHLSLFAPAIKMYVPESDVFVIEQADDKPFNRAKLLNIGFLESFVSYTETLNCGVVEFSKTYFVFHDVDKIPIQADYSYPEKPRQIVSSPIQKNGYFGGVTLFNSQDFKKVNGYSNNFWGWGGEDNEMYNNVINNGLEIFYKYGQFKSLPHKRNGIFDSAKWDQSQKPRSKDDGLLNCKYKVISKEKLIFYTIIKVEL